MADERQDIAKNATYDKSAKSNEVRATASLGRVG